MSNPLERRRLIVEELLKTEQSYLQGLDTLYRSFVLPLTPISRGSSSLPTPKQSVILSTPTKPIGDRGVLATPKTPLPPAFSFSASTVSSSVAPSASSSQVISISSLPPTLTSVTSLPLPSTGGGKILTVDDHNTLFDTKILELIINISQDFCNEIVLRYETWNDESCIGDILLKYAGHFNAYKVYARDHEKSVNHRAVLLNTNSNFREFCEKQQLEVKDSLSSFQILPIQRIPRYVLLLTEIQKNTPSTHPDSEHVPKALEAIKTVAESINKDIKMARQREAVFIIQSMFTETNSLLTGARYLVRRGPLLVNGSIKEIFLFDDLFIQASPSLFSSKFKKEREIHITDQVFAFEIPDQELSFGLNFLGEIIILTAKDVKERRDWQFAVVEGTLLYFEKMKSRGGKFGENSVCIKCGKPLLNETITTISTNSESDQKCTDCRERRFSKTAPRDSKYVVGESKKKVSWSIKEGIVEKRSGKRGMRWQSRFIVILDTPTSKLDYYLTYDTDEPQGSILLLPETKVQVTKDAPTFGSYTHGWEVLGEGKRWYQFASENEKDRDLWIEAVKNAIQNHITKQDLLQRQSESLSSSQGESKSSTPPKPSVSIPPSTSTTPSPASSTTTTPSTSPVKKNAWMPTVGENSGSGRKSLPKKENKKGNLSSSPPQQQLLPGSSSAIKILPPPGRGINSTPSSSSTPSSVTSTPVSHKINKFNERNGSSPPDTKQITPLSTPLKPQKDVPVPASLPHKFLPPPPTNTSTPTISPPKITHNHNNNSSHPPQPKLFLPSPKNPSNNISSSISSLPAPASASLLSSTDGSPISPNSGGSPPPPPGRIPSEGEEHNHGLHVKIPPRKPSVITPLVPNPIQTPPAEESQCCCIIC